MGLIDGEEAKITGANTKLLRERLVAEFIGTFLPLFTVGFNVLVGNAVLGGVSLATVQTIMTYSLAGVSGANFNPAVSAALYLSKKMGGPGIDGMTFAVYVAVQLVAGICCGFCFVNIFWDSFRLGPGPGFSWMDACCSEFLYSLFLCFVVLNTTAARKHAVEGNQFYGLAIGAITLAGSYSAAPVSGGILNPATTIGVDLAGAGHGFGKSLIYASFQMLGGMAAASLFRVARPEDFDELRTPRTRLYCEFIGTFALVLTVGMTVLAKTPMAVLAIAGSLTAMVYSLGDVSGGHFNPAVTLAVLVSGQDQELGAKRAGFYSLTQILGGVLAALTYCIIHRGNAFPLGPGAGYSMNAAVFAEMFFTAILAFVVLSTAVLRTKSTHLFGFAIGLCIVVGGTAAGKVSGGSLNPAVSVGVASVFGGWAAVKNALRYSFFELVGGTAAGALIKLTHATEVVSSGETKQLFGGA